MYSGQYQKLISFVREGWLTPTVEARLKAIDADTVYTNVLPADYILRSLQYFSPKDTRVIILGQDPYHTAYKANGLAFGVQPKFPHTGNDSLGNIIAESGAADKTLISWARQGVLLLNTILSVEVGKPMSHADRGWEDVVDALLTTTGINPRVPYLLWGRPALSMYHGLGVPNAKFVSSHPSPRSARKGEYPFIGADHFAKVNAYLPRFGIKPIKWDATDADFIKGSDAIKGL